jgi:polysaccharide pyruvyl transferase WcaK-like protein
MLSHVGVNKFCIVNFTGYRKNWGCQATSWELMKFLNGAMPQHPLPEFSYVPLLPACDIDAESEKYIPAIYAAIEAVGAQAPNSAKALALLERICVERYGFWVEDVRAADVVFFQGEGTMSGSTEYRPGARLLLLPFVAKHAWHKPIFSLNQSIFGTDHDLLKAVARTYNSFDFTAVRESASFDFARGIGFEEVCYVPDAAFLTKPSPDPDLPVLSPQKEYFCVTGTALRQENSEKLLWEAVERIIDDIGLTPIIAVSKDKRLEKIAARLAPNQYELVPRSVYYPAVAHVLQQCKFLIGGRYHMAIMAAAVGTPAILLRGNTFKNEGLAAMLRSPYPVRAADDTMGILADVRDLMANLPRERRRLSEAVREVAAALDAAQRWFTAALRGENPDRSGFVTPPKATVPPDSFACYSAVGTRVPNLSKFDRWSPAQRFGERASLEETLELLLAGEEGDPIATRAMLRQALKKEQQDVGRLPQSLKRRLALSLANGSDGLFEPS